MTYNIEDHITESITAKISVLNSDEVKSSIESAADIIVKAFKNGNKILLCGNGGSAADCQHIAAEFVSLLDKNNMRKGLPAIALTVDTSFLTAYSNDFNFQDVFYRQTQALGQPGDVLIGITTSGTSKNVINAAEYAKANGIHVIGLTGNGGGKMNDLATVNIVVPHTNVMFIQETHLMIEHIICSLVEEHFQPEQGYQFR